MYIWKYLLSASLTDFASMNKKECVKDQRWFVCLLCFVSMKQILNIRPSALLMKADCRRADLQGPAYDLNSYHILFIKYVNQQWYREAVSLPLNTIVINALYILYASSKVFINIFLYPYPQHTCNIQFWYTLFWSFLHIHLLCLIYARRKKNV